MKNLIKHVQFILTLIFSWLILGFSIPVLISLFITLTTNVTFESCVQTGIFWIFTILGLLVAGVYLNAYVSENDNEN